MKKVILFLIYFTLSFLFSATPALACTVSVTPSSVHYNQDASAQITITNDDAVPYKEIYGYTNNSYIRIFNHSNYDQWEGNHFFNFSEFDFYNGTLLPGDSFSFNTNLHNNTPNSIGTPLFVRVYDQSNILSTCSQDLTVSNVPPPPPPPNVDHIYYEPSPYGDCDYYGTVDLQRPCHAMWVYTLGRPSDGQSIYDIRLVTNGNTYYSWRGQQPGTPGQGLEIGFPLPANFPYNTDLVGHLEFYSQSHILVDQSEPFMFNFQLAPNSNPEIFSQINVNPSPINVSNSLSASTSFQDQDTSDTHTAVWNWGDGETSNGSVNESNGSGSVSGQHSYTEAGTYTITLTVTDSNGRVDTETTSITVIDPSPVTLTPTADSYLKQGSSNQNEGASTFIRLQSSGHNRGLVKFDQSQIASAIGNNQNYTATLQFTITDLSNNWGTSGRPIAVHRFTKDWAEGNGFVDNHTPIDRGTGNGVTWNCAVDSNISNQAKNCSGTTEWNMSNSSLWPFASAATATSTITNNQTGVVSFDVTADVQSFVNASNQNYGWLLKKVDEGANGQIEFGTKESGSSPQLVITFN